jgi:isopenicillin-N N-acyltransferase-like protein
VIFEKTPDSLEVYDPHQDYIVCANHFQSKGLGKLGSNILQIKESASAYRYQRLKELLDANGKNTVQKTVNILRDRKGLGGEDIGLGNEKAINQLIAHHSIVFDPNKLMVWVSTTPWQLGEYVAYDLRKVFAQKGMKTDQEISDSVSDIAADPFLTTQSFHDFIDFRKMKQSEVNGEPIDPKNIVALNPAFYQSYVLAGDFEFKKKDFNNALSYYRQALSKVIATWKEEEYIQQQINKCLKK